MIKIRILDLLVPAARILQQGFVLKINNIVNGGAVVY